MLFAPVVMLGPPSRYLFGARRAHAGCTDKNLTSCMTRTGELGFLCICLYSWPVPFADNDIAAFLSALCMNWCGQTCPRV